MSTLPMSAYVWAAKSHAGPTGVPFGAIKPGEKFSFMPAGTVYTKGKGGWYSRPDIARKFRTGPKVGVVPR